MSGGARAKRRAERKLERETFLAKRRADREARKAAFRAKQADASKRMASLRGFRREMLLNPTPAERELDRLMCASPVLRGRYESQVIIGDFAIVDFCFEAVKLVVEADGRFHRKQGKRELDLDRTAELEQRGYMVIRLRNEDILREGSKRAAVEYVESAAIFLNRYQLLLTARADCKEEPIPDVEADALGVGLDHMATIRDEMRAARRVMDEVDADVLRRVSG